MDRYSSSSPKMLIGIIRQLACSKLAHVFLCNAVEVGVDTPEAEEYVIRLEQLAHESQKYLSLSCAFVPDVYLGIYCRLRGKTDGHALSSGPPCNEALKSCPMVILETILFLNYTLFCREQETSEILFQLPTGRKAAPTPFICVLAHASEG